MAKYGNNTGRTGLADDGYADQVQNGAQIPDGTGLRSIGRHVHLVTLTNGTGSFTLAVSASTSTGTGSYQAASTGVYVAAKIPPDANSFDVSKVVFTSSPMAMRNWNTDFEHEGSTNYSPNGWQKTPSAANPVLLTQGTYLATEVTHKIGITGLTYQLSGSLSQNWLQSASMTSTYDSVTAPLTSMSTLLPKVYKFDYNTIWNATFPAPEPGLSATMGSNSAYVSWSPPLDSEVPTLKRVHWAVTTATGSESEEAIADAIGGELGARNNKSISAQLDPGAEWKLLDGAVSGDCDDWARLMARAMHLLGVSADAFLIRASTDENVTDLEHVYEDPATGEKCYLIMDFNNLTDISHNISEYSINAYEGACSTASHVYTLFPYIKGISDRDIFRQLSFTQFQVLTDKEPGLGFNWRVISIVKFEPKPILIP